MIRDGQTALLPHRVSLSNTQLSLCPFDQFHLLILMMGASGACPDFGQAGTALDSAPSVLIALHPVHDAVRLLEDAQLDVRHTREGE